MRSTKPYLRFRSATAPECINESLLQADSNSNPETLSSNLYLHHQIRTSTAPACRYNHRTACRPGCFLSCKSLPIHLTSDTEDSNAQLSSSTQEESDKSTFARVLADPLTCTHKSIPVLPPLANSTVTKGSSQLLAPIHKSDPTSDQQLSKHDERLYDDEDIMMCSKKAHSSVLTPNSRLPSINMPNSFPSGAASCHEVKEKLPPVIDERILSPEKVGQSRSDAITLPPPYDNTPPKEPGYAGYVRVEPPAPYQRPQPIELDEKAGFDFINGRLYIYKQTPLKHAIHTPLQELYDHNIGKDDRYVSFNPRYSGGIAWEDRQLGQQKIHHATRKWNQWKSLFK